MKTRENLCTKSGCHAGCCTNTVMQGLDPKTTLPWLREISFTAIESPEQLAAIQQAIEDNRVQHKQGSRTAFVVFTSQGFEVHLDGLCPSNSGPPDYNCNAPHRPEVCENFPFDGFSCASQKGI